MQLQIEEKKAVRNLTAGDCDVHRAVLYRSNRQMTQRVSQLHLITLYHYTEIYIVSQTNMHTREVFKML